MKSICFDFFATKEDLLPGVLVFEAACKVQYVLEGLFKSPTPERYASAPDVPDFGHAIYGHRASEKTFLVIQEDAEVVVRPVSQRDGSTMYSVDLMTNPTGFSFRPGGVYGDHFIIDGSAGTATGNADSMNLCKEFIRMVRKDFTRVHSYYVGPQALRLMDEGYRLTPSIKTPESFDLRRT